MHLWSCRRKTVREFFAQKAGRLRLRGARDYDKLLYYKEQPRVFMLRW